MVSNWILNWIFSLKDTPTNIGAPLSNSLLYELSTELKNNPSKRNYYFSQIKELSDVKYYEPDFVYMDQKYVHRIQYKILFTLFPYFLLTQIVNNKQLVDKCIFELTEYFFKEIKKLSSSESRVDLIYEAVQTFSYRGLTMKDDEQIDVEVNFKNFVLPLVDTIRKEREEQIAKYQERLEADEERKNIEKDKNFKETGIKETDVERRIREEIDKNFNETGIRETDYQRQLREEESNEKDKNFKETGIRETNFERNLREDEEKVIKEETEGDELIQQYGFIAESYYEEYKNGLIDIEKLRKQLTEMKNKGMLKQDYIDYLLETIEEE